MMKKIKFLVLLFLAGFSVANAQTVKIKGKVKFKEQPQMAFLSFRNGENRLTDSAEIKNGKFSFKETLVEPVLANLSVRFPKMEAEKRTKLEGMQIFLEPGKIKIDVKDSMKLAEVEGSKAQTEYEAFNKLLKPYTDQQATFGPRYQKFREAKDEAGMKSIEDESEALSLEQNEKIYKPYIQQHPNSPISIMLLNRYVGYDIDPNTAAPLYNSLSEANKNTFSGKALNDKIEIAKKTAVGVMAMNFTQDDTLGKPVSLSDFRGKYVLVDFWASWCGPCRAENPNVVKTFHEFKDRGFTVLGVSLDQPGKKEAWLKAINKDGLTWNQVSDLKFWNNAVAKQYGISAIPQNFLIDPTGKIVAKNIRGEELRTTLASIIK